VTLPQLPCSHQPLSVLRNEDVDAVTSCARDRVFAPGEKILLEGHVPDTLHLVRRGNGAVAVHPSRGKTRTAAVAARRRRTKELADSDVGAARPSRAVVGIPRQREDTRRRLPPSPRGTTR